MESSSVNRGRSSTCNICKQMKIFIVTSCLRNGGAERVAATLANGFSDRGHSVFVLTNTHEKAMYSLDSKIKLQNFVGKYNNRILKWGYAIYALRKYIKEYNPDVIIGIMELCSFIARVATIGLKVPVIATEHNSFERPNGASFSWMEKFSKFSLNKIYKHVTVLTKADIDCIGNRLKNVTVMPNPLYLPLEEKNTIKKEKIILAAGRIDAWYYKGFDLLLRAWGNLAKEYPTWKLQIAGNFNNKDSMAVLNKIISENEISSQVEFLGFRENLLENYKKSSIFVLSSRYEGFGLVLIEAMSQGCACIACDYKGRQREIIRNEMEGMLCSTNNVEEITLALKKLLDDDEYRISLQQNAIKRAKFYSVSNIILLWEKYIESIIL